MTYDDLIPRVRSVGVIPIITPLSVDFVMEIAGALILGGATGIEIVLRSPAALAALAELRARYPDLLLAAGTVLSPDLYRSAAQAGADFCISPGTDPEMVALATAGPLRLVPGVQTSTEVLLARKSGVLLQKFYPAEPAGGVAVLADYANVYPDVSFMPSGKIGPRLLAEYAALGNIASVGGSWMYQDGKAPLPSAEIAHRMADSLARFHGNRAGARPKSHATGAA